MAISLGQSIFLQYLVWHFFDVPKKILRSWGNFLVFNLQFFSIFELLKTFFMPWRRYTFSYPRGFDFQKYAEIFFSNLISRVLGAVMKSFLIILGLLVEIIIISLGVVIFFTWLLLSFLLIILLYLGLAFI